MAASSLLVAAITCYEMLDEAGGPKYVLLDEVQKYLLPENEVVCNSRQVEGHACYNLTMTDSNTGL